MPESFAMLIRNVLWITILALALDTRLLGEPMTSLLAAHELADRPELAAFADGNTLMVFAHQDDDVLWMLPFWSTAQKFLLSAYPAFPQLHHLILSFSPQLRYAQRWEPIWQFTDADTFARIITDRCLHDQIIHVDSLKERLRPFVREGVKRVVTHNNWGEYGHHQHRLVNQAVRELAVEYQFDVYALGVQVHLKAAAGPAGYINVADQTGLPQPIEGFFDPDIFHMLRQVYLNQRPVGNRPETTKALQRWARTLWTWSDAPLGFPTGWRPFIKLVSGGEDLTIGNDAVRQLSEAQPRLFSCGEHP